MNYKDRLEKLVNRVMLVALTAVVLGLALNAMNVAKAVQIFGTTPVAGNGRGGQAAARPACVDTYRGRTWALYASDGTKSDVFQACLNTSGGGLAWVLTGVANH